MNLATRESLLLELLEGHARGKGLPFVARTLAELLHVPVLFTNAVDRILVLHDPMAATANMGEYFTVCKDWDALPYPALFAEGAGAVRAGEWAAGDQSKPCVYVPLHAAGRLWGHCVALARAEVLGAEGQDALWQASLVGLLILQGVAQQQAEQEESQDALIRDVLYNNYDSKARVMARAKDWNWDLSGPLVVAVVTATADQLARVRGLGPGMIQGRPAIYARVNDQLVMILPCDGQERRHVREAVRRQLGEFAGRLRTHQIAGARVGVGSLVTDLTDLYRSYQEAKVALEMGQAFAQGEVCHFDEMGVFQFIFTQPANELQDFCDRVLGPILAHDAEMGTELMATVEAYIAAHCQISDCARALYVHENTLRNRLKKLQELTGQDLRRVDQVVSLFIALQIMRLGRDT